MDDVFNVSTLEDYMSRNQMLTVVAKLIDVTEGE